jgi:NodT family efflux transporter outer membrane factor (OMF) lipoprotein
MRKRDSVRRSLRAPRWAAAEALVAVLLGAALLPGCLVGPDYVQPDPEMPDLWHQNLVRGMSTGEANLEQWWTTLEDPQLVSLIERSVQGNLDVREALARVMEARALLGIATGDFSPQIDGVGSEQRTRASENVFGTIPPPGKRTDTFYSLAIDSSWEIDVWGRVRRSVESADAGFEATVEDYRDVLVSLYGEVATTYVEVRALQERIRFAVGNVETQRGSFQLTVDRRDAGIGSDLDVAQAEQNLWQTEAFIPNLRSALARAIHRLGALLGEPPGTLYAELEAEGPIPTPPAQVLLGLPAELLRQRPDIRSAERQLAAQTARVGVATADLYPRFSLTGFFAFESLSASNWIEPDSAAYSFGPTFRWNLFDGGRIRNAIQAEDERTEQTFARYEQTVLRALEEVENAVVAYAQESERRDALDRAVEASRKAVELVNTLYKNGLTDFQNVLDSERSLFEQEDQLALSEGVVTQNLIAIYKALGGGWAPPTSPRAP